LRFRRDRFDPHSRAQTTQRPPLRPESRLGSRSWRYALNPYRRLHFVNPAVPASDVGAVPGAVGNAYKSDLANASNFTTNEATAAGKLGGYTDQWLNSNLASNAAARKIGVGNADANSLKSLLGPEQDLAGICGLQVTERAWRSVLGPRQHA
jgi:hypothetical protein